MSVLFIKINNFMCNNSFFSFMNEQKELLPGTERIVYDGLSLKVG